MCNIKLGRLKISKITEMEAPMPLSMALPEIGASDLEKLKSWYWDNFLSTKPDEAMLHLSIHSFVLQIDGLNILIDSCNGNDKNRCLPFVNQMQTPYLDTLEKAGLKPEDIHIVMCTHLHADHVGWNTRLENGKWVPTFPNARYLFGRKDLEFYQTQTHELLHHEAYIDSILPIIEAGRHEIVESDQIIHKEIGNGIWLEDAGGHSPGSLCIHAQSEGDKALFTGDCFHHPIQLVRPDVHFFADEDGAQASKTRTRIFETYADTNSVILPAHFAGKTAGRIKRFENAFKFEFLEN